MAAPGQITQVLGPDNETSDDSDDGSSVHISKNIQRQHSSSDVPMSLSVSSLPSELLLKIFSFLDMGSLLECSKVSMLWNSLALDPYLWENVDIAAHTKRLLLEMVARYYGASLKTLRVQWNIRKERALHKLISGCPNLEIIIIRNCDVSDHTLRAIAFNCKNLKHLNVERALDVTGKGIKALCQNCHSLENLELQGAAITEKDMESIALGCPRLKSFRCDGGSYFSHQSLRMLLKRCPELKKVSLRDDRTIMDEHVMELASNCSGLTHLSLISCSGITNASLFALSKRCAGLEDLNFHECFKLSHDGFAALVRNCIHLKRLDLTGNSLINDETISVIVDHCPSLVMLNLSFCKRVTDASLACLGTCTKMTHLGLCGNDQITDIGVGYLSSMDQLRVLRMKWCSRLSQACLYPFAQHSKLELLEVDPRPRSTSAPLHGDEDDTVDVHWMT